MENQMYSVCALSTMHHQFGSRVQFADVGPIKAASRYDCEISVFSFFFKLPEMMTQLHHLA